MKFTTQYAFALVGAMGLMGVAVESAHAIELNGKGSSAGRNYAGDTPGRVCSTAAAATYYFEGAVTADPTLPARRTEWRCTVPGLAGTTIFRYHATNSSDSFNSINTAQVLTNAGGYLNTQGTGVCTNIGGTNPRPLSGHPSVTIAACNTTGLLTDRPIHYGASDAAKESFAGIVPPIVTVGDTVNVNAVPFGIAVGSAVLQQTGGARLSNLSTRALYQIFSKNATTWEQLGHIGGNIVTCQRSKGSGTLAVLEQTIQKKGPHPINLGATATNIINASSDDMVSCMTGTNGINTANFTHSIGYIDSDSLPKLQAIDANIHFVKIDGFNVFDPDPLLPVTAARLLDLRCGDYPYWGNWRIVIRTDGYDGRAIAGGGVIPANTDTLLDTYVNTAIANNPLQGFWATEADMIVSKNADEGPHAMPAGNNTGVCNKPN